MTRLGTTENARGYEMTTGGITIGLDYRLMPNLAVGVTMGYANTGADLTGDGKPELVCCSDGLYGYASPDCCGLQEYRRQSAPGVKITVKNFGRDRRYPIVNRFRDLGLAAHEPDARLFKASGATSTDVVDF